MWWFGKTKPQIGAEVLGVSLPPSPPLRDAGNGWLAGDRTLACCGCYIIQYSTWQLQKQIFCMLYDSDP